MQFIEANVAEERKQIGARLSKDLVAKLGHVAIDRDVTLNDLIESALADWYRRQPEKESYGDVVLTEAPKPGKPSKKEETRAAPVEAEGSVTKPGFTKEQGSKKPAPKRKH